MTITETYEPGPGYRRLPGDPTPTPRADPDFAAGIAALVAEFETDRASRPEGLAARLFRWFR